MDTSSVTEHPLLVESFGTISHVSHITGDNIVRSQDDLSSTSKNRPETIFLKIALGQILPKALSEICEKRPPDPIEELAKWLYQWADCELYYYEKAIFAKEIQLMALQLEKENARRLARMAALKREMSAIKFLLANEKAMASFIWKSKASRLTGVGSDDSDADTIGKDWPKKRHFGDEFGTAASGMLSPDGRLFTSGRRHTISPGMRDKESDSRKKHRKGGGADEDDPSASDSRGERKKGGRRTGSSRKGSAADDSDYLKGKKKGKKAPDIEEGQGLTYEDDSYGSDAKRKYGFECTPVRCNWYLAEPRILVCVHPVLGEIRASIPSVAPIADTPEWWEQQKYHYEVMYDHEVYTIPDPNFDDNLYEDHTMIAWADQGPSDVPNVETDERPNAE